ncbi:hypothetical protein FRC01_008263 [Tulasnella sp. 417]|nr:hypothetical protein FRC01_008263 [Tulasnella sp. 417]
MNSPRFSNLVTLHLEDSSSSTPLKKLLPVLASSRRLEKLHVHGGSASDEEVGATTPVTLPLLKELVLYVVPRRYAVSMLASIYTPRCSHAQIYDNGSSMTDEEAIEALDAVVWRPGNSQATVILGGPDITPRPSALVIGIQNSGVSIRSSQMEGHYCSLGFARVDVPRMLQKLVTFLSEWHSCPPLELHLGDGQICRANGLDLSFWGERVSSLSADGEDACRSLIQLLSRRELVPGSSEMDWAFPKLSRIEIAYGRFDEEDATLDAEALLSLVQRRWFGEDGLPPAPQPSYFEVSCSLTDFPRFADLASEFTRIIPSFQLNDMEYGCDLSFL